MTKSLPLKPAKGVFPFRLATTSFIYRDTWAQNARLLAPVVDELEVLIFQGRRESDLPSEGEIGEMVEIGEKGNLGFHVHLPYDADPCQTDKTGRAEAVAVLLRAAKRTAPLNPTTWTLHLPFSGGERTISQVAAWQERAARSLENLAEKGLTGPQVSIETLDYPPQWFLPLRERFNTSVCMDTGHLALHGFFTPEITLGLLPDTSIFHLHGVENEKDHTGLSRSSESYLSHCFKLLKNFTGIVSLEVFNEKDLADGLETLLNRIS